MDRILVRFSVVYATIYFLHTYLMAWFGVYTFNDLYIVLFEISLCVVMSSHGKYHCKYMKYTAYGVTTSDGITRADNVWDFIPCDYAIYIPATIVGIGITTSFLMSLRHFYKVKQLKRRKDELHRGRTE